MLLSGKARIPTDLLDDTNDVMNFDQSKIPCGDDEDNCSGSGSGEELILNDISQNKGNSKRQKFVNRRSNNTFKQNKSIWKNIYF